MDRDCFCFCAFTSLRYSDLANLKRTDIEGDTMYVTTIKTNDRLPINLNSFAKAILEKGISVWPRAAGSGEPADEPLPEEPLRACRLQ